MRIGAVQSVYKIRYRSSKANSLWLSVGLMPTDRRLTAVRPKLSQPAMRASVSYGRLMLYMELNAADIQEGCQKKCI